MSNALEQLRANKRKKRIDKKSATGFKGGRIRLEEKDAIRKLHMDGLSDVEISKKIGRSPDVIKNIRHKDLLLGDDLPRHRRDEIPFEIELTQRPEWVVLQQQFTKAELELFKIEYARLMTEMKDDLRPSDAINIFSLIKHMILIDRNYIERKRTMDHMDALMDRKEDLIRESKSQSDERLKETREEIKDIDIMLAQYMSANTAKTNELKSLEERKAKIQEQLKITRDQRISKLESNKRDSFIDVLVDLENEQFRKSAGQMMEINRMAMYKEMERLSQDHVYMDGRVSKPILTAETYDK